MTRTTVAGIAVAATATIMLIIQPEPQTIHQVETIHHVETIERVQEVPTIIDLDKYRDVPAASPHDDELMAECAWALQRLTGEPLMGIILYLEDHWNGDACAAYEHQVLHGWY